MESKKFECKICLNPYDEDQHAPRIIPICGHTLCTACIRKLTPYLSFECPFDKKKMYLKHRDLQEFPKNYALMDEVELNKPEKCAKHGKNLGFVCKTDMVKLCYKCYNTPEHRTHEVVELQEFNQEMDELVTKITDYKTKMETIEENECKIVHKSAGQQRSAILKTADEGLKECIKILTAHKEKIINETYSMIDAAESVRKDLIIQGIKNPDGNNFAEQLRGVNNDLANYQANKSLQNASKLIELSSKLPPINQWSPTVKGKSLSSYELLVKEYFQILKDDCHELVSMLSFKKLYEQKKTLFVNTPDGETHAIYYYNNPTIKEIAENIPCEKDILSSFNLYYQGKLLSEKSTLTECGIMPGSTIEIKAKPVAQIIIPGSSLTQTVQQQILQPPVIFSIPERTYSPLSRLYERLTMPPTYFHPLSVDPFSVVNPLSYNNSRRNNIQADNSPSFLDEFVITDSARTPIRLPSDSLSHRDEESDENL